MTLRTPLSAAILTLVTAMTVARGGEDPFIGKWRMNSRETVSNAA